MTEPVSLSYRDPPIQDDVVALRRWAQSDLGCVEEASREGRIPEGMTISAKYDALVYSLVSSDLP